MENQKLSPTPYIDELQKDVVALILKLQQQQTKTSNTNQKDK